jgi:hypothetical protein
MAPALTLSYPPGILPLSGTGTSHKKTSLLGLNPVLLPV